MFYQFFLYSRISSLIHSKYNSCIYYPKLPVPPRLSATTSLFSKSITLSLIWVRVFLFNHSLNLSFPGQLFLYNSDQANPKPSWIQDLLISAFTQSIES